MSKKRIFISSVQREFYKERVQLCNYIRQDALLGRFFEPFLFEELPAINALSEQAYLSEVANCDIFMGILGEEYGFHDHEGVSPTEREFDEATSLQEYRICFFKTSFPQSQREAKQQIFIEKVEKNVVRKTFDSFETLRSAAYSSLVRYLEENEMLRLLPFDAAYHPEVVPDDIDEKKIDLFVRVAQRARNFPLPIGTPIVDVLTHLNLITVKQQIKNAAILLFGKNPQRFFPTSEIKCAQFYGNEVTKPIPAYHVYQGDLFSLVTQALDFVASRIDARVGTREHSVQVPIDFELPLGAVREAIVNAVAHRDYTSNASIQVMLFRNRLEVWNPGHLPPGITIEQLSQVHESFPTNPLIANPLYLAGLAERLGTGTSDIIKKCEAIGLKTPTFEQSRNFRTIFWRNEKLNDETLNPNDGVDDRVSDRPNDRPNDRPDDRVSLNEKHIAVLEFCKQARSGREILTHISIKYHSDAIKLYIHKLVEMSLLEMTIPNIPNHPEQEYKTKVIPEVNPITLNPNDRANDRVDDRASNQVNNLVFNSLEDIIAFGNEVSNQVNDQVNDQVDDQANDQVSNQIRDILSNQLHNRVEEILNIAARWVKRDELLAAMNLSNHHDNRKKYLDPLLKIGWIEMEFPDKKTSPNQRYRITASGKKLLEIINKYKNK